MCSLRISGPRTLTALLTATLSLQAHAQPSQTQIQPVPASSPIQIAATDVRSSANSGDLSAGKLPDAPGTHTTTELTENHQPGSITGSVLDANGAEVPGALVVLENLDTKVQRTMTADGAGSFKFDTVEPGRISLTITSEGFAPWVSTDLTLQPGQFYEAPEIALQVASAMTEIAVNFTQHDIAEEQMTFAEKQRVLGVFPNFYASYVWDAAPLSSGQKFRLAWRTLIDPVTIAIPAIIAGVEQSQNGFSGYGQGTQGYAKRFSASYTDTVVSTMIVGAILPTVLHQDPRYFYKGKGSIRSRALYAMATVFICKGDNRHWQPNYSNVLGSLASAGISNAYYPSTDRNGIHLTIDNWLVGMASGAAGSLFQEFLVKKISHGIQPQAGS